MCGNIYPSAAVVSTLGDNISQVNTLAEHVTVHWRFWRSNTQTLAEDTSKVGCP